MVSFFRRLLGGRKDKPVGPVGQTNVSAPAFNVGDRVADTWGNQGVVVAIDPNAEHGLGVVKVQFDDGRETRSALIASGLEKIKSD